MKFCYEQEHLFLECSIKENQNESKRSNGKLVFSGPMPNFFRINYFHDLGQNFVYQLIIHIFSKVSLQTLWPIASTMDELKKISLYRINFSKSS